MIDDVASPATDFIAQRRDAVVDRAAQDLQQAPAPELPDVLHRLAGKLGVFGHEAAGDAARQLMHDLSDGLDIPDLQARVGDIVSLLTPASGDPS